MTAEEKENILKSYLRSLGSVAVAFSGGVDSTYLLKVAHDTLGDRVIAVTARSASFPKRELTEATEFCEKEAIRHFTVDSEELNIEGFSQNPPNRCYLCKKELFTEILGLAGSQGITYVAEGSNMDDNGDYRPGLQAVAELGIKSPLRYAKLYKKDIRERSHALGLPTWKKQSFACLSSRFVYGETISVERLGMVDKAEQLLLDMGFHQVRVRIHGGKGAHPAPQQPAESIISESSSASRNRGAASVQKDEEASAAKPGRSGAIARIEVQPEEMIRVLTNRDLIVEKFREYGFTYVTLDLAGYRTGSMNEVLPKEHETSPDPADT